MNASTQMAIDAFRVQQRAARSLRNGEARLLRALRAVPEDEFILYVLTTEVIRLEEDMRDAQAARDESAVTFCRRRIAELDLQRAQLKQQEQQHVGMRAHDSYAAHSHKVRADHKVLARQE